jgi:protein-tyrosine phosphatase
MMPDSDLLTTRNLDWEGCHNARDLGGLPTEGGQQTRWKAVIRSDLPGRLSSAGRQAMLDYGVRTIVDLRAPWEAAKWPSATFPYSETAPTYLNRPLEKYYPHVGAMIERAKTRTEVYSIILDHYPDAIAEAVRAIATAQPGGVLIHCHNGKDRTGMITALLLRLAGVPGAEVAADYAESQLRLRLLHLQAIAEAGGEDKLGFWSRPTVTPETMLAMLAHLQDRYGGAAAYLRQAGLMDSEMRQMRNRLLPPDPRTGSRPATG